MELNELMAIWNNTDNDLEKNVTINRNLLKEISILKIKTRLSEIKWNSYIQVVANMIFLIFLMGFIFDYLFTIKYAFPAIMVLFTSLSGIWTGCYKLVLFYRIDSQKSIVENQKNVERLKYLDLLEKNLLYIVIPLYSAAFMIVVVKEFLNLDLYAVGFWLVIYTAASAIIAMIIVYFMKKFPDRNLQTIIAFLKEIKDMENNN